MTDFTSFYSALKFNMWRFDKVITSLRHDLEKKPILKVILQSLMIGFFAIAGVIMRLILLNAATKYHLFGSYAHFLPNSVGSLIMGFISPFRTFQKAMPLTHKSIATGFCGSLTTFSSWMFATMSISDTTAHGVIEELVSGLAIPVAFFLIGRDISISIEEYLRLAIIRGSNPSAISDVTSEFELTNSTLSRSCSQNVGDIAESVTINSTATSFPTPSQSLYLPTVDVCIMFGSALFVVVPIILLFTNPQSLTYNRHSLITCLWAPTGAIVRMIICDILNPVYAKFKIGTFLCNALATFLDGVLIVTLSSDLTQDVMDGQLGSLSTVSSWINDAYTIRTNDIFSVVDRIRYSFLYYFGTVLICICIAAPFTQSTVSSS